MADYTRTRQTNHKTKYHFYILMTSWVDVKIQRDLPYEMQKCWHITFPNFLSPHPPQLVWLLFYLMRSSPVPAIITLLSDIMGGTVKIFKKCSPNGRVYLYLGNREYVSCDGAIPPVTGIVNIQDHHDTLKELYTLYDVLHHDVDCRS